ncbi:MAG: hypothetical protein P8Y94_05050, partial [Acidobacteriota bacterium]
GLGDRLQRFIGGNAAQKIDLSPPFLHRALSIQISDTEETITKEYQQDSRSEHLLSSQTGQSIRRQD